MKRFLSLLALFAAFAPPLARAGALTDADLSALCSEAENREHCGRLVETELLQRDPALARRDGTRLILNLADGARREFVDREAAPLSKEADRSYSLWAYYPTQQMAVIWAQQGDASRYWLVSLESGLALEVSAEPIASPDERYFAVADFCAGACSNQIALWEVREGRLHLARHFAPEESWREVDLSWTDAQTLKLEVQTANKGDLQVETLLLEDPRWRLDD